MENTAGSERGPQDHPASQLVSLVVTSLKFFAYQSTFCTTVSPVLTGPNTSSFLPFSLSLGLAARFTGATPSATEMLATGPGWTTDLMKSVAAFTCLLPFGIAKPLIDATVLSQTTV